MTLMINDSTFNKSRREMGFIFVVWVCWELCYSGNDFDDGTSQKRRRGLFSNFKIHRRLVLDLFSHLESVTVGIAC